MDDLPQIKLALSLHAPNQELREQIVPVAKTYKLPALMAVLDEYAMRTVSDGKRKGMVMVSYVLLNEVNDSEAHAQQLAALMANRPYVTLNLIPYNPFEGNQHDYQTPSPERVDVFLKVLETAGVRVFERRHHGRDIGAACGQLAKLSAEKVVPAPAADIESCACRLAKEIVRQPKIPESRRAHSVQQAKSALFSDPAFWLTTVMAASGLASFALIRWRRCKVSV